MKIKPVFRTISTLLMLILVANPILAAAGDLFLSSIHSKQVLLSSELSYSDMPCHQDKSDTDNKTFKQTVQNLSQDDCCSEVCLCDDSSCHGFSLLFQTTSSVFYLSSFQTQFHVPIYLSLNSAPKSPPPII